MDHDNEIMIDNVIYNAYFILGVTSDDTITHINKEFKKIAKILHPDKMSIQDRNDPKKLAKRTKQFKVLSDCFSFISNKKQSYNYKNRNTPIEVINNTQVIQQEFSNNNILDTFNDEFSRLKVQTPNDFGYTTERMSELSSTNFDKVKSQYQSETFKPVQLYSVDNKKFDQKDFNKTFEYHQSQYDNQAETTLIHKTSDGFNAYNSGFLSGSGDLGCASVTSFNGVMIVGDNFGKYGIGFNDTNFSDYKMSFQTQKNPESKISVPNNFKQKINKDTPLTQKEIDSQIRLRKNINLDNNTGPNKNNYKQQEELLFQNQYNDYIKNKNSPEDREFVLKYQHMFDKQTIQDAINKKLITNDDDLPQQIDPRQIDPRQIDPRQIDPRQIEPRQIDPRQIDPRYKSYFY